MNEKLYIEERIEDINSKSNSDEANEAIRELLEKNGNQEKNKIEEKNNEIQHLSLQRKTSLINLLMQMKRS